ncbi:ComF family protein [Paenibacillus rhizovicinus]|uniref:ComF family protein n=1 Tax=Paenibacillus rhizovicinus TaxID=2704463 RepID=A0A6C0P292_9BACL|nr:ComF family protein [Paenibacillus rhizovicinus]QHW32587.1 ComF family protein [Paenibacillus rhizovicinus]
MAADGIWQTIRHIIPSFTALLAKRARGCLICGNRCDSKQPGQFGALCESCYRAIPWITRVYCPVCGRPERCPDCVRRRQAAFIANRSAVHYDAAIREWLALYKYRGHQALEPLLGDMLIIAFRGLKAQLSRHNHNSVPQYFEAVVPVPVSESRLLERGFNQAERLAARLAASEELPLWDVLRRTRHSDKQSLKTRGARLRDTLHLFAADVAEMTHLLQSMIQQRPSTVAPVSCRLFLVDDIYTTGSTANACAETLLIAMKQAAPAVPIEIYCVTLARS